MASYKNILTLLSFCISTAILGQSNLNESCVWKVKELKYDILYYFNFDYEDYISQDTIIDNLSYHKVYRRGTVYNLMTMTNDTLFTSEIDEYKGAIREDDRIWYWIEKDSLSPIQLYDFNVQAGDTVQLLNSDLKFELTLTDSIFINNDYKKVFQLADLPILLIEDIGWNTGLLNSVSDFLNLFSFSYLQCYNNNDENYNPDLSILESAFNITLEDVEECENESTVSNDYLFKEIITVYPNPFQSIIHFDAPDEIESLSILNTKGEVVYATVEVNGSIDLTSLASGIYFLNFRSNGKTYYQKVIKAAP